MSFWLDVVDVQMHACMHVCCYWQSRDEIWCVWEVCVSLVVSDLFIHSFSGRYWKLIIQYLFARIEQQNLVLDG